jgi:hypothetical protein
VRGRRVHWWAGDGVGVAVCVYGCRVGDGGVGEGGGGGGPDNRCPTSYLSV